MGTSFDTIYDRALARFRDYNWLKYSDEDKEYLLRNYLYSAQADFTNLSNENIENYDEEAGCYNITLSNEVINILSAGVAYYWLSAKILNSENLRNYMSTKDYSYFSPANLLREMNVLKDNVYKEYQRLLTMHTYYKGNIKMPEK